MTQQLGEGAPAPPAGGPYVPPPDAGTPPNQAPAPVQQPPVVTPPPAKVLQTPPPTVAPPAQPEVVAPAQPAPADSGTELLGGLETLKPTLEGLKLPEGAENLYPKEFLSGIVSTSPTLDEAQKRFDTAHTLFQTMQQGIVAKNKEWIASLKQDPEVGKANWEASLGLYRKGVVEEFGLEFAEKLRTGKLDAEPNFFKAVVRRMRAKTPKPIVNGEPPASPDTEPKTMAETAKNIYKRMETGYSTVPQKKGAGW